MERDWRYLPDYRARARRLLEYVTDRTLSRLSSSRGVGHVCRAEQPIIGSGAHRPKAAALKIACKDERATPGHRPAPMADTCSPIGKSNGRDFARERNRQRKQVCDLGGNRLM